MRGVTEADAIEKNFPFRCRSANSLSSDDSRRHFEAGDVLAVGLKRPVHDELDFGISREHVEGVLIDVGLALPQRTAGLLAALVEEMVARRLPVDSDKWNRESSDHSAHLSEQIFN